MDENIEHPQRMNLAGHCVLLLMTPSDRLLYTCFKEIASRWQNRVTRERLWLEGDVPLVPALAQPIMPAAIARVLEADCALISKLEIELAGLTIRFLRSGGHAPFKESFFDELHLEVEGRLELNHDQLQHILAHLTQTLQVATARAAGLFATSGDLMTVAEHSPSHERRFESARSSKDQAS